MPISMTFCNHCGAANPANAVLCFACQQPVQEISEAPPVKGGLAPNQTLHQRYRILQLLGKGGFGAVYRGTDSQLGERALMQQHTSGMRKLAIISTSLRSITALSPLQAGPPPAGISSPAAQVGICTYGIPLMANWSRFINTVAR